MGKLALVWLLFASVAITDASQAGSSVFKADRAVLFTECSLLRNYEMDEANNDVVLKGSVRLTEGMRAGLGVILDAWERQTDIDKRRLAFILATARRESRSTFAALREAPGCRDDETCRERVIGELLAKRAERSGKPQKSNYAAPDALGRRYYGRGFIQLTFKKNYALAGDRLGVNLVDDPDSVMEPAIAADILVRAMLEGWYGSRRPLSFYINGPKEDWINARNNVNPGSPNKPVTAAFARDFVKCLRAAE